MIHDLALLKTVKSTYRIYEQFSKVFINIPYVCFKTQLNRLKLWENHTAVYKNKDQKFLVNINSLNQFCAKVMRKLCIDP